jgi:hypothetical protein
MEHHDHPAGPSQPDEGGFEEGFEEKPDSPDEHREPDFARGIDEEHSHDRPEGRYSRGIEDPATEEESKEGRFSEGIEQLPHERE